MWRGSHGLSPSNLVSQCSKTDPTHPILKEMMILLFIVFCVGNGSYTQGKSNAPVTLWYSFIPIATVSIKNLPHETPDPVATKYYKQTNKQMIIVFSFTIFFTRTGRKAITFEKGVYNIKNQSTNVHPTATSAVKSHCCWFNKIPRTTPPKYEMTNVVRRE